jgi:hypothetical protein
MKRLLVILGLAFGGLAPAGAFPAPPHDIHFKVFRDGEELGHHRVRFTQAGPQTIADVEIEFAVTLVGIRVFHYLHRSREVWENGALVSIDSSTSDDGDDAAVKARRDGDGLAIQGTNFSGGAAGDLLPTSYWFPQTVEQSQLLDTTNGRVFAAAIEKIGVETVEAGGRTIEATRYTLTEQLTMNLWYDTHGNWVKTSFDARGSIIDYVLQPPVRRQADLR